MSALNEAKNDVYKILTGGHGNCHFGVGESMEEALGLVCGSRAHLEEEAIASRSMFRTLLMKGSRVV